MVRSRCNPSRFFKFIGGLGLKECHKQAIEKTPFGHLIKEFTFVMEHTLTDELIDRFDSEERGFRLGNQIVEFRSLDVALILGLTLKGRNVDLKIKGKSDLKLRYFKEKAVNRIEIEKLLQMLVEREDKNGIEDFTKNFVTLVFCEILFPLSSLSLPDQLLRYVDDLDGLKEYAWGDAVYRFLIDNIHEEELVRKRSGTNISKGRGYISGCTLALNIWYYEHLKKYIPRSTDASPRLFNWDNGSYKQKSTYKKEIDSLTSYDIINRLQVHPDEYKFLRNSREEIPKNNHKEFKMGAQEKRMHDLEGLLVDTLLAKKNFEVKLAEVTKENKKLKSEISELRDEVMRLRKGKKRPNVEEGDLDGEPMTMAITLRKEEGGEDGEPMSTHWKEDGDAEREWRLKHMALRPVSSKRKKDETGIFP